MRYLATHTKALFLVAVLAAPPGTITAQSRVSDEAAVTQPAVVPGTVVTELPTTVFEGTVLKPGTSKAGPRTAVAVNFLARLSSGAFDDAMKLLAPDTLYQEIGSPGSDVRGRDSTIELLKEFRSKAGGAGFVPTRIIETKQIVAVQASVKTKGANAAAPQSSAVDIVFLFWVINDTIHKTNAYLALDQFSGQSNVPARPATGVQQTPIVSGEGVELDEALVGQVYGSVGVSAAAAFEAAAGQERPAALLSGPMEQDRLADYARSLQADRRSRPDYRVIVERMYTAGDFIVSISRLTVPSKPGEAPRRSRSVSEIVSIGVTRIEANRSAEFQFYVDQRAIRGLVAR